jgi:TolB-like protein/DNA-binding winged helix-turn-helix (wHTH) protein/Flp pilus assembly protein TadD
MVLSGKKLCEFGPYRLDQQKRQLWRDGQTVPLTAKAMEILVALVERRGYVVSRQELIETIWPDSYVEEANLTQNVFLLRKALGETAHDHNYILTVPGKGYRFAAEVREISTRNGEPEPVGNFGLITPISTQDQASAAAAERQYAIGFGPDPDEPRVAAPPATTGELTTTSPERQPATRRNWLPLAAVALLLFSLAAYLGWHGLQRRDQPAVRPMVIAVLPFANLTGDRAQDYFSDGLTEEMIHQVGRVDPQHLQVIARTSVMRYKGSEQWQRIRQELGVDYVLEGSVRRDANKVRIAAQLIAMKNQTRVWAGEYDRELTSLLVVQNTIAQQIADQIAITLGDHARASPPVQPPLSANQYDAYDLYLQGRYFWNKRTPQAFRQAIDCFERAIIKDPSYARAYVGLADSYVLMSGYSLLPAGEFMPKARASAQHALAIDETLAEAHTSLALIAQNYDWDWQTAEKEYRRAIELDPNYPTAHHWYAEHLALEGRFDEAFPEIERARQLDPLSLIITTDHAAILYFARQYDRAIQEFRTVLAMDPGFGRAHMLVYAYVEKGQYADAIADINKWRHISNTPWRWAMLADIYGRSGDLKKARHALDRLNRIYDRQHIDPLPMVVAYIGVKNKDEALSWLQKAYLQHSSGLTALKVDPIYDPLRDDPRFQDLLHKVGLTQ